MEKETYKKKANIYLSTFFLHSTLGHPLGEYKIEDPCSKRSFVTETSFERKKMADKGK